MDETLAEQAREAVGWTFLDITGHYRTLIGIQHIFNVRACVINGDDAHAATSSA